METVSQKIKVELFSRFNRLFASIVLFILLPPFLINGEYLKYAIYALLILVVITCTVVIFHNHKGYFWPLFITAITVWAVIDEQSIHPLYQLLREALVAAFFLVTVRKIILYILHIDKVNPAVIVGAISAYLLLGLVGAVLFNLTDLLYADSFNMPYEYESYYRMIYFSFVTLTTLGYGDITPISAQGKSVVLLVTLTGQLYLTVLMAMLVGKFLNDLRE